MLVHGLVILVASLHVGFLCLEMFLWTKPLGRRIFRQSEAQAGITRVLAANQGLYNGFLAAGLFWSVLHPNSDVGAQLATFFLACVIVAGVFGALTASRTILVVQALPGIAAFSTVLALGF